MAAMDDSSDADNEGELVGCFDKEDDKDFGLLMVNQTHLLLLCQPLTS